MIATARSRRGDRGETIPNRGIRSSPAISPNVVYCHILTPFARFRFLEYAARLPKNPIRSEEHTSELQSLMRISYAVFCLKKKTTTHIKKLIKYSNKQHNKHKTIINHKNK